MYYHGVSLRYYVVLDQGGWCSVALQTRTNRKNLDYQGPLFQGSPRLRDTMGIESPQVVYRDGIGYLF